MHRISKNLLIFILIICSILMTYLVTYAQPFEPSDNMTEVLEQLPDDQRAQPAKPSKNSGITINFDQVDLNEALKVLIKEGLRAPYVVSPRVTGRITIHSVGEIKKEQLLPLIEAILKLNNLSIVKKDGIYYIVPQQEAPGLTEKVGIKEGVGIYLFPLKYIRTDKAVSIIKPLLSPGTQLIPESYTNTLIVVGYPKDIEKIKTLIEAIDMDLFAQVKFKMFPLQYIKVDEMSSVLKQIFKEEGAKPEARPIITFIPFKSMNALLVLTLEEDLLNRVEKWIKELDVKPEEAALRVYVYPIENGDAEEIANLLKELFGEKIEEKPGKVIVPAEKEKGVLPTPTGTEELIAEVVIIPDKINNFLIIKATPPDYHMIERVIKELDIIPRQVMIETMLTEITLTKSIEYGVEWFIKHRGQKYIGGVSLSEGITSPLPEGAGETPTGFYYGLFTTPGQLRALIYTLAEISEVNILSTPLILVTDNTEASIKIGEEWPIARTAYREEVTEVSVEYKEVGILLTVKPHISSAGLVKMDLTQEISSVLEKAAVAGNPAFLKREAKSSLVVQSGQTVVLGGIFKTDKTRSTKGIPLLKDIPILGYLFGHKSWKTIKTELLIALTPRVIRTREEADAVNKEFLEKIEELKKRIGVEQESSHQNRILKKPIESKPEIDSNAIHVESYQSKEKAVARTQAKIADTKKAKDIDSKPHHRKKSLPQNRIFKRPTKSKPKMTHFYTIHVESYQSKEKAVARTQAIKKAGYRTFVTKVEIPKGTVWYRVLIGKFENKRDALEEEKKLKKEFPEAWTLRVSFLQIENENI
ncbi:MAG: hypothetical protein AMJ45_04320 [Syntrophobacter sp. DG_60]|nr:MAG: hypothetical protein AMJ45_04320 [Syntrophobacter sp. DG_60]